jgi:biotin transport system substrate-specific component
MGEMSVNADLLASRVWPATGERSWMRSIVLAIIGSAFVAMCAQVSIPMWPVPMTLQTLAVLAIGGAYGSRLGAATLCLYALEGAAGLPVFANFQAGLFLPTGEIIATGGYVIGFILAAGLVGWLAERGWDRDPRWMFLAMLLGGALLYVPGLIWLTVWFVELKGMTLDAAIAASITGGLVPFVAGDVVKAALAAAIFPAAWSLLGSKS